MNTTRKRTTVELDRRTAARVRAIAKVRKITVGDFMREATAAYVAAHREDSIPVTVDVTRCNYLRLERIAEDEGRSVADTVRLILAMGVKKRSLNEHDYTAIAGDMREVEADLPAFMESRAKGRAPIVTRPRRTPRTKTTAAA